MKPNSCNTCALKVSLSQWDKASAIRVDEIYAEFLRRNPKSNRICDIGGNDDKTDFCALGSRHFKNQGRYCCQWVPVIGLSIADALAINLNKKIFWLTVIIMVLTVLSVIGAFMPSKTPQPVQITTQNLPAHIKDTRQYYTSPQKEDKESEQIKDIGTPKKDSIPKK